MSDLSKIEKRLLNLPASEREQIILKLWDELGSDNEALSDKNIDAEGVAIAVQRDHEIEEKTVTPITKEEFLKRTHSS